MTNAQKVSTFLMFEGNAEEAINFYVSLFPDSSIVSIVHYEPGGHGEPGTVQQAAFTLCGANFMAIDSSIKHGFTFTPATSIFVQCTTAAEVDAVYEKLEAGGKVLMPLGEYPFSKRYFWVNDRFGVSWQLSYVG